MTLIIVESPTKARTFNRILKSKHDTSTHIEKTYSSEQYEVFATVGHFRDIPSVGMHINFKNNFEPTFTITKEKQKIVAKLLELAKKHKNDVILATDEDREGESISYHIAYVLGMVRERWPTLEFEGASPKRIVFHEITSKALFDALSHPGQVRLNLVKAQLARRILDRIVGYELSPLLWKKLGKNWLSAGRVQTAGLRLVVEREKEIASFQQDTYYQIYAYFSTDHANNVKAKLISKNEIPYEVTTKLNLFASEYEYTKTSITVDQKDLILSQLSQLKYVISAVTESEHIKYPPPPYSTSSLQIDAYHKLGYPSKLTMKLAQTLYERGLITYHRTDSHNLSSSYVFRARDYIIENFGKQYALEKPRAYHAKTSGAQQAHEAIRPTKVERSPKHIKGERKLSGELLKLYELIFNRALATQMSHSIIKFVKVHICDTNEGYQFQSDFQQVVFDGFLQIIQPKFVESHREVPSFSSSDSVVYLRSEGIECQTKPPDRYNDASLVRVLEDKGIGRPSTYAGIISNILDKHYVTRERGFFIPTALGTTISDYLASAFPKIFDLGFTAHIEEQLDNIADGEKNFIDVLTQFYLPFRKELEIRKQDKVQLTIKENILDEKCPQCGENLVTKYGRFGKFIACTRYPACRYIKKNITYLEGQSCPLCEGRMVVRFSFKSKRPFFGCENYPKCTYTRFTARKQQSDKNKTGTSERKI